MNRDARSSIAWNSFHIILNENGDQIEQFYYCNKCCEIKYRPGEFTTPLLRHACVIGEISTDSKGKIDQSDVDKWNLAAAKFVCLDLRPIRAMECDGAREFFKAGVDLGKKYPRLSTSQLMEFYPSRKSVKTQIKHVAQEGMERIKDIFKNALVEGGFGCTLDLWSDKNKHNSYMAMTANIYLSNDKCTEQKRIVFSMEHITEIYKSKELIKAKIIRTFSDFGVSEEDLKNKIKITTDR